MPAVMPAVRRRLRAVAAHTCRCSGDASDDSARSGSLYTDVDFPKDDEGRVHHLSVKEGEVANRVVSVGDPTRALALAAVLALELGQFERSNAQLAWLFFVRPDGNPVV